MQTCNVFQLGHISYEAAWTLQKSLAQTRGDHGCPDILLLLEHAHTYTLGSSGTLDHLLLSESELTVRGITVLRVDRGGDITYHGPGQLVGYPILQLELSQNAVRADVVAYVRRLEEMLIVALAAYGIEAERLPGYTGVWVQVAGQLQKIAAIGVKVTTRRITYHGFALNVNTDLHYFRGIIPCGIEDKEVTSMEMLLGHPLDIADVSATVIQAFGQTFQRQMQIGSLEMLQWAS